MLVLHANNLMDFVVVFSCEYGINELTTPKYNNIEMRYLVNDENVNNYHSVLCTQSRDRHKYVIAQPKCFHSPYALLID